MDLSLSVNQISGGGGEAVVAPLAYFPPFTSQFFLLGTLEVQYMEGVQPCLVCHHETAKKWLHSGGWEGWGEKSVSTLTVHKEGTRAKVVQSFLVSIFTLSISSRSLAPVLCVCFFTSQLSSDPADVSVVWIPERRGVWNIWADWHTSPRSSPDFPSHSSSLALSRILRLLSLTELQQVDIHNY